MRDNNITQLYKDDAEKVREIIFYMLLQTVISLLVLPTLF